MCGNTPGGKHGALERRHALLAPCKTLYNQLIACWVLQDILPFNSSWQVNASDEHVSELTEKVHFATPLVSMFIVSARPANRRATLVTQIWKQNSISAALLLAIYMHYYLTSGRAHEEITPGNTEPEQDTTSEVVETRWPLWQTYTKKITE